VKLVAMVTAPGGWGGREVGGEEVLRQGGLHMGKGNSEKGAREVAATF
jgi:hypothetical protein